MKIIVDTREKTPWDFSTYDVEVERRGLKTGDYSLDGIEDRFCIERKKSTAELSINTGMKSKQFEAEFQRMKEMEQTILICEFPLSNLDVFPRKSGIPKRLWRRLRLNGSFIKKRLFGFCEEYEVDLYFCKDSNEARALGWEFLKDAEKEFSIT